MRKKKSLRSPYLFLALAVTLLAAMAVFGIKSLNAWSLYRAEAAVTAAPSPTAGPVSVTTAPDFATYTPAPTATPAPTPAATPGVLKTGSSGEEVKRLQERLQALGYYQSGIDGKYGAGTKQAVIVFQKQHGLAADGAAGEKTFAALEEASGGVSAKSYTVTISGLDLTQARAIAANYPACSAISEGR